jgi:lauroyl/myristoyl acyltransferase
MAYVDMDLIAFINSRLGPMMGILLGRMLSTQQAYRLADFLGERVAARTNSLAVQAVRANQAIVQGLPYSSPILDEIVRKVMRNAARGYADWYRAIGGGPAAVRASVEIDERLVEHVTETQASGRGLVIVGAHMSSFNLMLLALGLIGYPIQALSYHHVRGAVHVDNAVRRKFGLNITPISMQSLRTAIERLKQGGIVMTGVDRPDVGGEQLTFFGRKTILPVGHARLAIQTNSKVLVGMVQTLKQGLYRAVCTPLIDPVSTGDRHQDVLTLAQQVIARIEDFVRQHPDEWMMFLPVWPNEMLTLNQA